MNATWPQTLILRAASLLAPANQRALWLNEWRTELWYIPSRGSTLFCLGAFRDALWLRRNNLCIEKGFGIHLESPLSCLILLAMLAVGSILFAVSLPVPQNVPPFWRLRARDLPAGWIGMLPVFCLFVLATRLVIAGRPCQLPSGALARKGSPRCVFGSEDRHRAVDHTRRGLRSRTDGRCARSATGNVFVVDTDIASSARRGGREAPYDCRHDRPRHERRPRTLPPTWHGRLHRQAHSISRVEQDPGKARTCRLRRPTRGEVIVCCVLR